MTTVTETTSVTTTVVSTEVRSVTAAAEPAPTTAPAQPTASAEPAQAPAAAVASAPSTRRYTGSATSLTLGLRQLPRGWAETGDREDNTDDIAEAFNPRPASHIAGVRRNLESFRVDSFQRGTELLSPQLASLVFVYPTEHDAAVC